MTGFFFSLFRESLSGLQHLLLAASELPSRVAELPLSGTKEDEHPGSRQAEWHLAEADRLLQLPPGRGHCGEPQQPVHPEVRLEHLGEAETQVGSHEPACRCTAGRGALDAWSAFFTE